MPKYAMDITVFGTVYLEAETPEAAKQKAIEAFADQEVTLMGQDQFGCDTTFEPIELSTVATVAPEKEWEDVSPWEVD
ncbi:MAG: hypothetical protein NXH70_02200 [Hyphomonas sp.]|nr:hypothetical protein [Hyphomonas sp.]